MADLTWYKTTERCPDASDCTTGPTRKDPFGRTRPIDHVPCLVVLRDRPAEVVLLQWNTHHLCWDDESGDDFKYAVGDALYWMPCPAPPPKEEDRG